MPIRQSFCYPCFQTGGQPVTDLFREAKAIGYEATEWWAAGAEFGNLAEAAHSAGLTIASFTGHESIDHGLNDETQHDRIEAELRVAIDLAAEHQVPGIICFAGSRHPSRTDLEGLVTWAKGVRRIAPYAEEKGINLNLETLNSRVDHPGYQGDHVDWCLAAVEMVGSPRVKILFDIYHVQIMEGDVIRRLRQAMPHIGHIHTAGNPGRKELNDGEMSYSAIMQALNAAGYEGFVGHEFFPRNPDRIAALREAFDLCNVA
jgi:hydroxypyruvate isomerase